MIQRSLIPWRLSAVFSAIILLIVAVGAYIDFDIRARDAQRAARACGRTCAATICRSIEPSLMTCDRQRIRTMFGPVRGASDASRNIRLVSHDGASVVSHADADAAPVLLSSRPCQTCHVVEEPPRSTLAMQHDEVVRLEDGSRVVSIVTPVLNEARCASAGCHADPADAPMLGFLHTEHSLIGVDALAARRRIQVALGVVIAVTLGTAGVWFVSGRVVAGAIKSVTAGMERIARGDLGFRMRVRRRDEFAMIADSFNNMTSKLELLLLRHRETRDYLEGIVESSADIIITVSRAGFIQTFNTGAEVALGFTREEVIGEPVERLFADPKERDVAVARLHDGDQVANYEVRFLSKDGEVRDVLFSISRLRGPLGFPLGTFAIGKDVTNEKKLQKQLIQSERFAAIGQSFAAIQHSMKNMLNVLPGGSYMVRKGLEKHDWSIVEDGWEIVTEGIDSIRGLSKNLLMYVKEWEPEFQDVAIADLIAKIEAVLTKSAADDGVAFTARVTRDLPAVRCDPSLIHTAIMDIASNAVEACLSKDYEAGTSPMVELTAGLDEGDPEQILIEIRDNGPGMTAEIKSQIFTPFFSTKKHKGTGLGLALTSRIVSLHGASIEVESEPDRYCLFTIALPVRGPETNKEDSDGEESAGHR